MDTQTGKMQVSAECVKMLEQTIINADMRTAKGLLRDLAADYGYEAVIFGAIEPILAEIGERLKRQEASLAQSYVASMIVDEVLRQYEDSSESRSDQAVQRKGPVVLGNIEDDCHPLGRKIVAAFLRVNNWDVRDLGIDVEAKRFVDEAVRAGARVIGVSAMIYTTAENIRKVSREIKTRGLEKQIKLAVGGVVFRLRPELAEEVGADGTAPNAFSAIALFERLWNLTEEGKHDE